MMKLMLMSFVTVTVFSYLSDPIVNSVWVIKISKNANDTLKFKSKNTVTEYDGELNYSMQGIYTISKDTVITTIKDDSHSEDGGKAYYFRTKYLLRNNNTLVYLIGYQKNTRNIWEPIKINPNLLIYKRVK